MYIVNGIGVSLRMYLVLWCSSIVYHNVLYVILFFFFQAEDGIRDIGVTGVQTCALPIYRRCRYACYPGQPGNRPVVRLSRPACTVGGTVTRVEKRESGIGDRRRIVVKIGRASCRERV